MHSAPRRQSVPRLSHVRLLHPCLQPIGIRGVGGVCYGFPLGKGRRPDRHARPHPPGSRSWDLTDRTIQRIGQDLTWFCSGAAKTRTQCQEHKALPCLAPAYMLDPAINAKVPAISSPSQAPSARNIVVQRNALVGRGDDSFGREEIATKLTGCARPRCVGQHAGRAALHS